MWINPMLSIWLYSTLGGIIVLVILLFVLYSDEDKLKK